MLVIVHPYWERGWPGYRRPARILVVPADTSIQPAFAPTRWSLVLRSRGEDVPSRIALEELCGAYWFPLYAWARRSGMAPADAEDAVQGFFAVVLGRRLFDRADESRGKLRTFLLTAFRRHIRDERDKSVAGRRGGGRVVSFDGMEAEEWFREEALAEESPEHCFDRHWALTVLERALGRVEAGYARRGKAAEFAALRPFLAESGEQAAYEAAGVPLGLGAGAFKVALHRFRGRFREALRDEVRDAGAAEADVDAELAYLVRILER